MFDEFCTQKIENNLKFYYGTKNEDLTLVDSDCVNNNHC